MQKSKKNSSQKKSKREQRANLHVDEMLNHTYRLGHCAQKYAMSLADPFSGPADACMPVTPAVLSRKARYFIRGQMSTSGVNGLGFATMQPLGANDGATTSGNQGTAGAYVSSSALNAVAGIPTLDPVTPGVIGLNHNGDYSTAQFGSNSTLQLRLVSMGMRLRYAGTELNRGGRVLLLEDPEHVTLSNTSLASFLAQEKAKEHRIGTDWITLCTTGPTRPNEYDYVPGPVSGTGTGGNNQHYLGAIVQSAANSQTFDVEFFWNYEFIGSIARGKTMSEADDAGVGVVLGSIKSMNDNQLDSKHPLVQVSSSASKQGVRTSPVETAKALNGLVQRYAAKNTSGWFASAVKGIEKYGGKALEFAGAAAPLLALL
jgi:hypothetical protein